MVRSASVATSQSSSEPDRLARRLGRQLEVEVVEPVVAQEVEHEVQGADQLGVHLLAGAEDVGVVLGHAAHPGQPLQHAGLLVAVDRAELEEPHAAARGRSAGGSGTRGCGTGSSSA